MIEANAACILEKLREFDRVALMLAMPIQECLGILNLVESEYIALRNGDIAGFQGVRPELERRLSYALPLMRRLAANSTVLRIPGSIDLAAA